MNYVHLASCSGSALTTLVLLVDEGTYHHRSRGYAPGNKIRSRHGNAELGKLILDFFSMDETKEKFGPLIGRDVSIVVVATSCAAVHYG